MWGDPPILSSPKCCAKENPLLRSDGRAKAGGQNVDLSPGCYHECWGCNGCKCRYVRGEFTWRWMLISHGCGMSCGRLSNRSAPFRANWHRSGRTLYGLRTSLKTCASTLMISCNLNGESAGFRPGCRWQSASDCISCGGRLWWSAQKLLRQKSPRCAISSGTSVRFGGM